MGDSVTTFDAWGRRSGLGFGMFVIVVSWLQVILLVVLFVAGLHEKITLINWPLTVRLLIIFYSLFVTTLIYNA